MQEFIRKDFDENRFKLVFLRYAEVEQALRQRTGTSNSMLEEENHVVSQLGKSIINNSKLCLSRLEVIHVCRNLREEGEVVQEKSIY